MVSLIETILVRTIGNTKDLHYRSYMQKFVMLVTKYFISLPHSRLLISK